MSASCTLICPEIDFAGVLSILNENPQVKLQVEGPNAQWDRLIVSIPQGSLKLSSLYEAKDAQKYSSIGLGLYNFVNVSPTDDAKLQEFLKAAVFNAPFIIGVVAEPGFEDMDVFRCLADVTQALDALIFSGSALLAPTGHPLLDDEGQGDFLPSERLVQRFSKLW